MNRQDHSFLSSVDGDWVEVAQNEWELLTCILLDTRTPVERLRKVLQELRSINLLDFRELGKLSSGEVEEQLRHFSYPWARQKSSYFQQKIEFDLTAATFKQIDSIKGIGPKLASLWMRIMHPNRKDEFVVIDTHVLQWLRKTNNLSEAQMNKFSYRELSEMVRKAAKDRNQTVSEFDNEIVSAGIRKRRGF